MLIIFLNLHRLHKSNIDCYYRFPENPKRFKRCSIYFLLFYEHDATYTEIFKFVCNNGKGFRKREGG